MDKAVLTIGHNSFFGLPSTGGVYVRQRLNLSGQNTGRDPISVAADVAFNLQLWALPSMGVGYMMGTDKKTDGAYVDLHHGPFLYLRGHPDYGDCAGVFLPGIGGLILGSEIIAFGMDCFRFGPWREGGFFFLRHPGVGAVLKPVMFVKHKVVDLPVVQNCLIKPVEERVAYLKQTFEPLRKVEERVGHRVAAKLDGHFAKLRKRLVKKDGGGEGQEPSSRGSRT